MELEARAMGENEICLHCESKEKPNHDYECKSWDVLPVDEDRSDGDTSLIMSNRQ